MATKPKKNKYEESREIQLVDQKDAYNEIGQDEPDATGRANIASKTRQNAALTRENTSSIKVDEKNLAKKKTITVPECEPDPTYYELIKNKKELVEELHNQRGYFRAFLQDHLPNPDHYDCTDVDLEAIAKINTKYPTNQQIRSEDFEKIVETWESEIGQAVLAEKKKNGIIKEEVNKMEVERGKLLLRENKDLAQFCKNPHFNSLIEEVHRYWDERRTENNHPFLRRYWRNYFKIDFKPTRKAFHEPRSENKMKTRQNDLDKIKDKDLDNKFQKLLKDIEKAKLLVDLVNSREVLKNLHLENSIKNFYLQANASQDLRPLNSDIPDSGIRSKIGQIRKQCDSVNKIIQPYEQPYVDPYKIKPPTPPMPKPPIKKYDNDDDLTFFICSVVSELANRITIKEWGNTPADSLVKKFKEANRRNKTPVEVSGAVPSRRDDVSLVSKHKGASGSNKNLLQLKIYKRYSKYGQVWLERYSSSPTDVMEAEDPKSFLNKYTTTAGSYDDRINQMKMTRYEEFDDFLCFEDREDDLESQILKDPNLTNNFRSFQKTRRVV